MLPVVLLNPVDGDQLYVSAAPLTVKVALSPSQIVGLFTVICGRGFTTILKLWAALVQPACVAVTVMLAVTTDVVLLTAVKLAILPVPDAPKPIEVLLLVQLMLAVDGLALKLMAPVGLPAHTTMSAAGIVNAGGLGSDKVNGPTLLEGHPFRVTLISL